MYDIQQTALFGTMINIQCKDTLQIHCDSFGFLRTEVAKLVRSLGPKWPRTEMTSDRTGCTDRSQDWSDQGPKWPHTAASN